MSKLRLFAFILLGIVIFTSCRKSKDTPANASIVRVMVSNNKGEVQKNTLVRMYDPASFEVFKKDPTTAALLGVATNDKGIATFELQQAQWFKTGKTVELYFVVAEILDKDNFRWWSEGGTITLGKNQAFKIVVEQKNPAPSETDNLIVKDNIAIGLKNKDITRLVFPENIKGIADEAFAESALETVVLNEGLLSIGKAAFRNSKVSEITFPSSLEQLGENAFEDCHSLLAADLSATKLKTVSAQAFRESGLKSVLLSASVETIGYQAFLGVKDMAECRFPEKLQTIEEEAFRESGLVRADLPSGIKEIGYMAFAYCPALQTVSTFGEAKNSDGIVGVGAFSQCDRLKEVELPHSVAKLEGWTFVECPSLANITLGENLREVGDSGLKTNHGVSSLTFLGKQPPVFGSNSLPLAKGLSIWVPQGTTQQYQEKLPSYLHSVIKEKA